MSERKKILVTGGAGYIGAHTVVELVKAGYHPVVVDDLSTSDRTLLDGIPHITGEAVDFHQGSCTDKAFLKSVFGQRAGICGVLHFAAFKSVGESVTQPMRYYRNNIDSLLTVLEVMKEFDVTDLIFSSSCTVYGQPERIPVDETAPFRQAESPYGATKQMGERILEDAAKTGFRIIPLRYFNPVGAHPSGHIGELPVGIPNNLVPYITQTAAGIRQELVVFGADYDTPDGSCLRDFIHVVDVARAHVQALGYLRSRTGGGYFDPFNLGTGIAVSVLELIHTFEEATGVKVRYRIGDRRPGDVVKVYADPARIMKEMGWSPLYTIREAMTHAWAWEQKTRWST